ncbi:hypothetical protein JA1_005234 [Spathaspora sp. JA1]|nr:hypothetical protein JA1_005234 [Spathaspora sp. JA1]
MSNYHQQVTLKITINRVPEESASSEKSSPLERTIYVGREEFLSIRTKSALTELLSKALHGELTEQDEFVTYTRKSKKHKNYVALDSVDDFKSLARSLKVKNHVRLVVMDSSPSDTYTSDNKFKKRKTTALDIASLGDALIATAFEHFRELFNDLALASNSEFRQGGENTAEAMDTLTPESSPLASNSMSPDTPNPPKEENVPVHTNICCDVCHPNDFVPMQGVRYCCLICPNFDLCSSCEAKQQSEKKNHGAHLYSHAMAKITEPNPSFFRQAQHPYPVYAPHAVPTYDVRGNDIILDIPLNGSKETNEALEKVFGNKTCYEAFATNIQRYIKESERYKELLELVDAKAYEIDPQDDELRFAILKSIIEAALMNEVKENSVIVEEPPKSNVSSSLSELDSAPIYESGEGQIVIRPKKSSQNARIISLMLTNNSNEMIMGGSLRFEFFNSGKHETVVVKNASDVKPGQQRFYNLGKLNDDLDKIEGTRLRITTPNSVLEGDYANDADSFLAIATIKCPVLGEFVHQQTQKSETDAFEVIDEEKEIIPKDYTQDLSKSVRSSMILVENQEEEPQQVFCEGDEVLVSLVPKSGTLAQIVITNKSEKTIDCSDLKFEIINCFNKSIVAVIVRKKHGIMPGKVGKFNIGLINAHTKYPFKLLMKNEHNIAFCDMNSDCLSGKFTFETIRASISEDDADGRNSTSTESINENLDFKERESFGSFHSMVLPEIPRESFHEGGSEYLDAIQNIETAQNEDGDEEYDVISVTGDEEVESDFEILSSVSSTGQ